MNCREVRSYLDLFHDDELEIEKNLEVLKHLNLCPACTDIYDGERIVRDALKRRYESTAAPEGLKRRVRSTLRRPRWIPAAIVAGVAAALLLAVFAVWPASRLAPTTVAAIAMRYHVSAPKEAVRPPSTGEVAIRRDLAEHFQRRGAESCLHDLSGSGYQHASGAVLKDFRIKGVACWTVQESAEGHRITHINFPSESVDLKPTQELPIRIAQADGRIVVLLRSRAFV